MNEWASFTTEDDLPQVTVCQGPPCCEKQGDDAVAEMKAGCVWCERHTLQLDGSWHVHKPGAA